MANHGNCAEDDGFDALAARNAVELPAMAVAWAQNLADQIDRLCYPPAIRRIVPETATAGSNLSKNIVFIS